MTWDPAQYLKFADHRLRPALDLLARVPLARCRTAWDLGCGTGNVTRLLAERWPEARVIGLDSSRTMLAKASVISGIEWIEADAGQWLAPAPADLIFSNAALHWVPDHARLFPHLMRQLAPGGMLAVQMPRNHLAPSHTSLRDTARDGRWAKRLAALARDELPVAAPSAYYDWLAPEAAALDIWETEYLHVLEGENAVLEWVRGTALRPFLDALTPDDRAVFVAAYGARLRGAYPRRTDGRTLFPFRRLFIVARR